MSNYRAPLRDMQFALRSLGGLGRLEGQARFDMLSEDLLEAVLAEAARFAEQVLGPTYRTADRQGTVMDRGEVHVAPEMKSAYADFVAAGWVGLAAPLEFGGQGLPNLLALPVAEMWRSANLSFALCPMLTQSAIEALSRHGTERLKAIFLPKLVTGEWTGTMNLTEPQAGSDLALLKSAARPEHDHYRITGKKIFITWGDHDMTENIVHFVLARLPNAPPGVKGISLFLVPKYLVSDDGTLGERNDVSTVSLEHKLGIHGSPTCVLSYGDRGGAVGYLVGAEHQGVECMFTMMNRARLAVGVEGLAVVERAYQQALSYARQRVQGVPPGHEERATIIHHPDVRRMLSTINAYTQAMRSLAYSAALELDVAEGEEATIASAAHARVSLLTPIVKGWCTELAQELTSVALQVHGGMGYIEETGAAQTFRDARITSIYEGTTAIQANDLLKRKVLGDDGRAAAELLAEIAGWLDTRDSSDRLPSPVDAALRRAVGAGERALRFVLTGHAADPALVGAVAVNFLLLFGTLLGGWHLARQAVTAAHDLGGAGDRERRAFLEAKRVSAVFYAEHLLPRADAYCAAILAGSASIMALHETQF